jgi:uncharacterized RDD family membrane protein YckC
MSYTPPPPPPAGGDYPPPAGGSPYGAGASRNYAEPVPRILAGLIDYVAIGLLASLVQIAISRPLGLLISLAGTAFGLYNGYLNGETGQSIGKKMQGIKVISMETGTTIGGGMGIARYLLHIVDACTCGFGYIFGLFIDKDKQTFSDKIIKTVVVKA